MRRLRLFLAAIVVLTAGSAFARVWTDVYGKVTQGRFVRYFDGNVILLRGTQVVTIPYKELSDADQEYVIDELEKSGQSDLLPPEPEIRLTEPDLERTWTSNDGKKIQAQLVAMTRRTVTLLVKGKEVTTPMKRLSSYDQSHVKRRLMEEVARKQAATAPQPGGSSPPTQPGGPPNFPGMSPNFPGMPPNFPRGPGNFPHGPRMPNFPPRMPNFPTRPPGFPSQPHPGTPEPPGSSPQPPGSSPQWPDFPKHPSPNIPDHPWPTLPRDRKQPSTAPKTPSTPPGPSRSSGDPTFDAFPDFLPPSQAAPSQPSRTQPALKPDLTDLYRFDLGRIIAAMLISLVISTVVGSLILMAVVWFFNTAFARRNPIPMPDYGQAASICFSRAAIAGVCNILLNLTLYLAQPSIFIALVLCVTTLAVVLVLCLLVVASFLSTTLWRAICILIMEIVVTVPIGCVLLAALTATGAVATQLLHR
jgi:hypothetical protein